MICTALYIVIMTRVHDVYERSDNATPTQQYGSMLPIAGQEGRVKGGERRG